MYDNFFNKSTKCHIPLKFTQNHSPTIHVEIHSLDSSNKPSFPSLGKPRVFLRQINCFCHYDVESVLKIFLSQCIENFPLRIENKKDWIGLDRKSSCAFSFQTEHKKKIYRIYGAMGQ